MLFKEENFKTCFAFHFLALETLFLEHSQTVQMTRTSQILSLIVTVSEQGGTNICRMIYQDINFKICLSLFGWKENILPKQHIVQ